MQSKNKAELWEMLTMIILGMIIGFSINGLASALNKDQCVKYEYDRSN